MKTAIGTWKNQTVHQFVLENEAIRLELLDFGARVRSCYLKQSKVDVVQGFDDPRGYVEGIRYMGATVGRVANRIGQGTFVLHGKRYWLSRNDRGNTLHGGEKGLDLHFFEAEEKPDRIIFSLHSPDQEEGFPGNLTLLVSYQLLKDGWAFETEASCDQDTLCSITNHAYFNLSGHDAQTALDHLLKIEADQYSPCDRNGLTLPVLCETAQTPFDFREKVRIDERLDFKHPDIQAGNGYDHNFILRGKGLRPAVEVTGRAATMQMLTTMPCLHFYSANFLGKTIPGKQGVLYEDRSALCFEPQYFPNAIQYSCAEAPILCRNEKMHHRTEYHFKQREAL